MGIERALRRRGGLLGSAKPIEGVNDFWRVGSQIVGLLATPLLESLQGELAEIGHDRGFARGDAIVGQKDNKIVDELIDRGGGVEIADVAEEIAREESRLGAQAALPGEEVVATEVEMSVSAGLAAAMAAAVDVLAS
jgi:hypothetical protein